MDQYGKQEEGQARFEGVIKTLIPATPPASAPAASTKQ